MIQRRHRPYLTIEAIAETLGGNLDRDLATHSGIACAVHLTHAARANRSDDLVWPEMRFGSEAHFVCPATRRRTSSKKFVTSVT
jgi:hypothetical protein